MGQRGTVHLVQDADRILQTETVQDSQIFEELPCYIKAMISYRY